MRKLIASILMLLGSLGGIARAEAGSWTFEDPRGDDKGHGKVQYPTDTVYKPGSFDLRKLKIEVDGDDVVFTIEIARKVEDPWNSKEWGGNGFSLQFIQVYLDIDHKAGSGHTEVLPGLNVRFGTADAWDKVVLISPQGRARLRSEVRAKAEGMAGGVVIPRRVRARGKKIVAVVSRADLGGVPAKGWGVQAIMQSNEGYPAARDLLTRKVNEINGPHRFGGGNDYDCDPHVIDLFMAPAKGGDEEAAAQYRVLKAHSCEGVPGKPGKLAVVPMVRIP